MISCTEFIPLYSELFSYIEEKEGPEAVARYWRHIADTYVRPRLGALVAQKGLLGCWEYWSQTLNEEAADFVMTYDEEAQTFSIDMGWCPSRGLLNTLGHVTPYPDYCGHCAALYAPILAEYGIYSSNAWCDGSNARCHFSFYAARKKDKNKHNGDQESHGHD